MARALTPTSLSLDRFAQIAGIHPLHFNQVYVGTNEDDLAPTKHCDTTLLQYEWQMIGGVSREVIAQAIAEAETDIETWLGYALTPKYFDRMYPPVRHYRADQVTQRVLVNLDRLHVKSGGVRAATVIDAGNAVSYADGDGDSYDETASCTFSFAVPADGQVSELHIFYPDRQADPAWEIRPVRYINNLDGTFTAFFRREQAVLPSLLERIDAEAVDGTDDNNFLEEVDVYRIWTDPAIQATMYSRRGCQSCSNTGCQACTLIANDACVEVVNNKLGQVVVSPGTYDADTGFFVNAECCINYPERIQIHYLAGLPLDPITNQMQLKYELAVARHAMTKLDRPLCACPSIQGNFEYWTVDLALNSSDSDQSHSRQASDLVLSCPWGTMRGAVWAWNLLRDKHAD